MHITRCMIVLERAFYARLDIFFWRSEQDRSDRPTCVRSSCLDMDIYLTVSMDDDEIVARTVFF